jgi:Spy/CpxP family protein refolding chaperone
MMKRAAPLAIILALCPALSFSQGLPDGTQDGLGGGGVSTAPVQVNEESALSLISIVLHLGDSQQQQLRAAFDAAAKAAAPIATQMEDGKAALFAAVTAGKSDAEIKNLAEQQGTLTSQMLMLQARTFAKLWAVLTSEQKSEVDDFIYANIRMFLPAFPQ